MASKGRSLELFFVDGRPDGLLVAELFNWTGHVLLVPRTQLKQALQRTEASYTGIYILLGEKDGEPLAYIGETEDIGQRIRSHDSQRDWWTKAVFITTADNKLNKAHVRYLEARCYALATSVGRITLENAVTPQMPQISEATSANMEGFLENLTMILPALGIDLFVESKRRLATSTANDRSTGNARFELVSTKANVQAFAQVVDGEFIVEKGSTLRRVWEGVSGRRPGALAIRQELEANNLVQANGENLTLLEDYTFNSPSMAASVALGYSVNGLEKWKLVGTKKSYKQWEAQQLEDFAEPEPA
ncbi:GIY-YIG nuclease family protein [Flexibacterium corallicola]|uniref:GIY-YIG nuclease family protein n=1 Tax=Flexibacterium corallicola TaxID=3037259 RepID=UPI00286EC851|nr:GIY-YIG nuclease family protein [Pseudovibrio sp. M1P-2-3]